jgi:hypothetical protein
MPKEKAPNLKTTMKSIEDDKVDKSEENAAGSSGEENTTDDPQSEEGNADSAESEEGTGEGEETEGDTDGDKSDDEPAERLEFYVEGEDPPAVEPKDDRAFAKYRKALRERDLELAELKRKLQLQSGASDEIPDPGPEPDETDEDINFDQTKLKKRVLEWNEKVQARKNWEAEQAKKAEAARQETRTIMDKYSSIKTNFSKQVKGYDEAEEAFNRLFDAPRQDVLFRNCSNPAKVIYLLHTRYPDLMERLSKSTNRDEIVRELVKLEVTVKERKVGTPPAPGKRIGGSGSTVQGEDPRLVAARKKAEKTNNYTEVRRIQREIEEKERANQVRK